MKKIVSLILVFVFLCGTTVLISASPGYDLESDVTVITNDKYNYSYTKSVDKDGRMVSMYVKNSVTSISETNFNTESRGCSVDYEEIRSLLLDLGMDASVISNFTEEDYAKYAAAKSIMTISSVAKNDVGQDESPSNPYSRKPPTMEDLGDNSDSDDIYQGFQGGNTSLLLTVADLGEGLFDFSISVVHRTPPEQQYFDAVGISASFMTVENNTRRGSVNYTNSSGQNNCVYNFSHNNYHNVINGNWNGSAATFSYNDLCGVGDGYVTIYYTYQARVAFPDQAMNFQVIGSYDHMVIEYVLEPSVQISYDMMNGAGYAVSYNIACQADHEVLVVELPTSVYYDPDN